MSRPVCGALLLLCLVWLPKVALGAEEWQEVWRSPFGTPYSVAVDPTDGSCWAATGGSVMHLSAEGETLSQTNGFWWPRSVSVDPTDGSCWVADSGMQGPLPYGTVTRLAPDGTRIGARADLLFPAALAVNTSDGSCWVADTGNLRLVHFSADLDVLWQGEGLGYLYSVAVNPADGSCWAGASGEVVHLDAAGTIRARIPVVGYAASVAVDPRDGSCWVAQLDPASYMGPDNHNDHIVHLSASGVVLWESQFVRFFGPMSVWVSPADGSCLVANTQHSEIVLLAPDGAELWRRGGFSLPLAVAASSVDGSILVGDDGVHTEIVKLDADGEERWRRGGMRSPRSISVDPRDGSCWVADPNRGQVIHLAENGAELLRVEARARSVSANATDGSCWVGDFESSEVVHVASDGTELWRGEYGVSPVCVNPVDGSCWIADQPPLPPDSVAQLVHLSASGTELWRGGSFTSILALAVNPADGSCWVADTYGDRVVHFSAGGEELWSGEVEWPQDVSVDPADGSCWVAQDGWVLDLSADGRQLAEVPIWGWAHGVSVDPTDGSCWVGADEEVVHLASDGTVLWAQWASLGAGPVSVNPADGTCWVANLTHGQVVHLAPPGYRRPTFSDVPSASWAFAQIEACVNAGTVQGFPGGTYEPRLAVTRDQAAVFVARALAGGDVEVPTPPATASFADVPTDHWAFRYIEYCHQQGVVVGYWEGYHPADAVTRDQMAVFVARAVATPTGEAGLVSYTPPATPSFVDVPTSNWAYKRIEYCKSAGVVQGYWDGYHPLEVVTRDQMAVYLARAFELP